MHILIVDADAGTAATLAELLEAAVAPSMTSTAVACDGEQAVRLGEQHLPDVAVLDILVPHGDALETGHQIRRMCGKRVFLIALSGRGEGVSAARDSGNFDHALLKPVDLLKLLALIDAQAPVERGST